MTPYQKGCIAKRSGLDASGCKLQGQARDEWLRGYRETKSLAEEPIDTEALADEFFNKHLSNGKTP